jgi:hypothetical protein
MAKTKPAPSATGSASSREAAGLPALRRITLADVRQLEAEARVQRSR